MRRLQRPALTPRTATKLGELTQQVTGAANQSERAQALWENKPKAAFAEIREQLERMASGRARCMYCEDSQGTDIDHFWPKAVYPTRAFDWPNYLLACSYCNSNLKRSAFPLDAAGAPLLLDPSADEPQAHLDFLPSTGHFSPSSPRGAASIELFGLNDDRPPRRLPSGRKSAFVTLIALIQAYDRARETDPAQAQAIKDAVKDHPFSAVLSWLVRLATLPAGPVILGEETVRLVQAVDLAKWL